MNIKLQSSLTRLSVFSYSSLTDIVLLLLVFFLLTSSFIVTEGLKINLPEAVHSSAAERSDIRVALKSDGSILINDAPLPAEQVGEALRTLVTDPERQTVVLSSDRDVPLERAVFIMDEAKGAGAVRFLISTFPKDAGDDAAR